MAQMLRWSDGALEIPIYADERVRIFPTYQTPGSSGMDLYAVGSVDIFPGQTKVVPTGIHVALPEGYEMQVRSRSGLAAKHNVFVLNSPGTIDADYRGEIKVLLHNAGHVLFEVKPGMRIAQLVLARVGRVFWVLVPDYSMLSETKRGRGGFGSTGV